MKNNTNTAAVVKYNFVIGESRGHAIALHKEGCQDIDSRYHRQGKVGRIGAKDAATAAEGISKGFAEGQYSVEDIHVHTCAKRHHA